MKNLEVKSPHDLVVAMIGMVTGCLTYISHNLQVLWAGGWAFSWEKAISLLFACLVAFSTGVLAVFGKKLGEHMWHKWFPKKNNSTKEE